MDHVAPGGQINMQICENTKVEEFNKNSQMISNKRMNSSLIFGHVHNRNAEHPWMWT